MGFDWSTLFTVCWNFAVCIAALISLLKEQANKINRNTMNQYLYKELEGDNMEYGTINKVDMFTGEVQANLSQTDRYQTL